MASAAQEKAGKFVSKSKQASPSPQAKKAPQKRVFGTSSQFRGIGVGVPGDPRK